MISDKLNELYKNAIPTFTPVPYPDNPHGSQAVEPNREYIFFSEKYDPKARNFRSFIRMTVAVRWALKWPLSSSCDIVSSELGLFIHRASVTWS